ncbi:hypothetical protein BBJ29_007963 [Phytophthora kernoviae]|uniref:Uncharacterized protein n=1 Tax=Phytophthora kernoviae TaxID=325452 RepID=A0A3R7H9I9_9STRA|nr:hypothetical protein BBJ29_007963 [Phytophthora kernoviae]
MRLRGIVGSRGSAGGDVATHTDVTAPNAKGELPPPELRYLTNASFPEGSKKAKGDYNPPQAHLLAASRMFRAFGSGTGKPLSAMSFALWLRELDCMTFQATPAVLMAIFSGRLGSRGFTLMHFKESNEMAALEEGSTNANFASDFSASATLPPTDINCATYEDILDALHGLNVLGQEVWYDHMRKLTSRLRVFVAKNKSADPANTPARVRLTLLYANKFLGAALGHLQADDPQRVLTQVTEAGHHQAQGKGRRDNDGRRENSRRPAIPDAIRRLIPMNHKGQEPCLLNAAGLPCSGGSRDRCGNPRRVHNWSEPLPTRLQEWIDRTYGGRVSNEEGRR